MFRRSVLGLAILVLSLFLATWGNWSHHALGRGWMTGLAFCLGVVSLTIVAAWLFGGAIEPRPGPDREPPRADRDVKLDPEGLG